MFKALFLGSLIALFSSTALSSEVEAEALPTDPNVGFQMRPFSEDLLRTGHFLNQYEIVIVVNRANKGSSKQSLRLYDRGTLVLNTLVSTGREKVEKKRKYFWEKGPNKTYFSSTNPGYFPVQWINEDHKSKTWRTKMPYSIFFDGGIAIHQAPKGTEGILGSRASGGCVRVSAATAPTIFAYVENAGTGYVPDVARNGEPVLDANGNIKMRQGHRAIVIVEDVVN